jgi:Transposase IS116/IS110/IS902 family
VTKQSGSMKGEQRSRRGNHRLKNALWLAAFCSLHHEPSRDYYPAQTLAGQEAQRCDPLPRPAALRPHPQDAAQRPELRRDPIAGKTGDLSPWSAYRRTHPLTNP